MLEGYLYAFRVNSVERLPCVVGLDDDSNVVQVLLGHAPCPWSWPIKDREGGCSFFYFNDGRFGRVRKAMRTCVFSCFLYVLAVSDWLVASSMLTGIRSCICVVCSSCWVGFGR